MRDFRPVAPPDLAAADPLAPADDRPDGGRSAMRMLSKAAHIGRSGVASGSPAAPAARSAPDGRIDLAGLAGVPPVHRPTVTGAAAGGGRAGNHVGGAMLPTAANTVALSDGTRISFGAVAEVPEFADA